MSGADPLITSLKTAVQAAPTDVPLRVHLATLLEEAGDAEGAMRHAAAALHAAPDDVGARGLMARLLASDAQTSTQVPAPTRTAARPVTTGPGVTAPHDRMPAALADAARLAARAAGGLLASRGGAAAGGETAAPAPPPGVAAPGSAASSSDESVVADTRRARREAMLRGERTAHVAPSDAEATDEAPFVPLASSAPVADVRGDLPSPQVVATEAGTTGSQAGSVVVTDSGSEVGAEADTQADTEAEPTSSGVTFADVGGMEDAKERIAATVIAPLRNPTLRRLYARGLAGGVLYYGPPGAGKTLFASAIAGELGADFVAIDLRDAVLRGAELDAIEGRLADLSPVLVCLKHVDALSKSSPTGRDRLLRRVERLLDEAASSSDPGVFVFATTDTPWEVDPSLRRGGRLERAVFVTPPDADARAAILTQSLARMGETAPDLRDVSLLTDSFSGHDLHRLVELADERRRRRANGAVPGPVLVDDLKASVPHIAATSGTWLENARSQARLAADETTYAGLHEYLKASGRW